MTGKASSFSYHDIQSMMIVTLLKRKIKKGEGQRCR